VGPEFFGQARTLVADDRPRPVADVEVVVGGRLRARRTARSITVCTPTSSRARTTSSVTRSPNSTVWTWIRSMIFARCPAGSGRPVCSLRARRSTFVRRLVSGVRSSWAASETRSRCRHRESWRAAIIAANARLSRPTSSRPEGNFPVEPPGGGQPVLRR
jgi:hypothetical protein